MEPVNTCLFCRTLNQYNCFPTNIQSFFMNRFRKVQKSTINRKILFLLRAIKITPVLTLNPCFFYFQLFSIPYWEISILYLLQCRMAEYSLIGFPRSDKCTIMEKSSAPSSIERNQFERLFPSTLRPLFLNEQITMVHLCTRSIDIGSLLKKGLFLWSK